MRKLVEALFWISLAAFILLGAVVVVGQILGTIAFQPAWVAGLAGVPSTAAFVMSTVCALAAFTLQYIGRPDAAEDGQGQHGSRE